MTVTRPEWGSFVQLLMIKDMELTEAEERSSFEPLPGTYECMLIGRSGTVFAGDDGTTGFAIGVTYEITGGEFAGKKFYSQDYNFNEKGIGWTKAFVKSVAGLEEAPNTAQEISDALDLAIREGHLVHLDVKYRTFTTKKGDQRTVIQDKVLEWLGASKKPADAANPDAANAEVTSDVLADVPITIPS